MSEASEATCILDCNNLCTSLHSCVLYTCSLYCFICNCTVLFFTLFFVLFVQTVFCACLSVSNYLSNIRRVVGRETAWVRWEDYSRVSFQLGREGHPPDPYA